MCDFSSTSRVPPSHGDVTRARVLPLILIAILSAGGPQEHSSNTKALAGETFQSAYLRLHICFMPP